MFRIRTHQCTVHTNQAHKPSTKIIIIRWVNIVNEKNENRAKKRRLKNETELAQQQFEGNNKELGAFFCRARWHQQIETYV